MCLSQDSLLSVPQTHQVQSFFRDSALSGPSNYSVLTEFSMAYPNPLFRFWLKKANASISLILLSFIKYPPDQTNHFLVLYSLLFFFTTLMTEITSFLFLINCFHVWNISTMMAGIWSVLYPALYM